MFPPPPARSQYSVLIRVRVMGRVRCRVRSRLRVGVGVRVKVGFKYSVGGSNAWAGRDATWARGMKKKFSGAFGATICMVSSH